MMRSFLRPVPVECAMDSALSSGLRLLLLGYAPCNPRPRTWPSEEVAETPQRTDDKNCCRLAHEFFRKLLE